MASKSASKSQKVGAGTLEQLKAAAEQAGKSSKGVEAALKNIPSEGAAAAVRSQVEYAGRILAKAERILCDSSEKLSG